MEHSGPSEVTGADAAGPDPQLAVTMGFTGFGKKARTFDLEAMFEQTRRTAVERSRKTLEAREKEEEMNREKELRKHIEDVEPAPSSSSAVREHPKPASRDTSSSDSEDSSDSSDDELIGPPLPPKTVGEPVHTVDEDILGPLPPPLGEEGEDDDDDDFEDEGEEEVSIQRDTSSSDSEDSSDSSDDELIGPPLPPKTVGEPVHTVDEDILGPLPPPLGEEGEDDDDDDLEDEGEEENPVQRIPDSHEITLKHGTKTVSALGLDPSGARLVTGGYDYDVKFWDFAGMDASFKAFRSLQPCECHQIKSLQYSNTGDMILVVSGSSQAKVIDRDGFEVMECIKGDQYIVDMANTKGHTAMLHTGSWHPKIKGEFMTCSNDATVRLWEVENPKKQKSVFKPRTMQGKKVIPTTCTYSRDGNLVAAACQNGSIQIWDRNLTVHPKFHYKQAHDPGTDTSCVAFSYDGNVLASRGGRTDCCFSPDDKLIVTGTSVQRGCGNGKLVFFERRTFQRVYEIDITDASVVRCLWHPKLNQIMVGTGNGLAKVYYDPNKSQRGAKLCVVKTQRKAKQAETLTQDYIITPHALPMFREPRQRSTRKQLEKDRLDPLKSHKPEPPVAGPGRGGRVGTHGGTLSSYIVKNIALDKTDDSNPREAILRHAKAAEDNPYWVSPAYSKTQPKTMFAQVESDDEDSKNDPEWKKRRVLLCSPDYSGTHFVSKAGLELTEILLLLPPKCWD
ncbi:WD repeat-containing protein 70 [Microtus ochrogaster]|uniref:WD repeat-containing protein 70 n=1 Tax=Microtus ochrogaster TaxID=79684 RepID=A0A8J6H1Q0_MICOH|nr:WD repeat-containing protein 70 [Microtus ochrogaster]